MLRGPQGTLRGRPSSAGAITFTTKRPDLNEITGYVSLAFNNLDQTRGEAAIGVPLITDVLAVRVAGIIDRNDNDGVRSLYSSQKPYQHMSSWRASMRFKPTEDLDINVMYQDFKSVRGTLFQVAGPGYQGPSTPINPVAQVLGRNFNGPAISAFDRLSVSDSFGVRDEHHKNLIGNISLDLGSHRLSYVGEYNTTRNINFGGLNAVHVYPIPYPDPQLKSLDGRSKLITQELRFETTGAKFWDYGIGFYYEKNTSDNLVDSVASYLPGTYGNPRSPSLTAFNYNYKLILTGNFPTNWKNQAIYANSTFHITPETDLFVGVRHVWYEQSSDQIGVLSGGITATGQPLTNCRLHQPGRWTGFRIDVQSRTMRRPLGRTHPVCLKSAGEQGNGMGLQCVADPPLHRRYYRLCQLWPQLAPADQQSEPAIDRRPHPGIRDHAVGNVEQL